MFLEINVVMKKYQEINPIMAKRLYVCICRYELALELSIHQKTHLSSVQRPQTTPRILTHGHVTGSIRVAADVKVKVGS